MVHPARRADAPLVEAILAMVERRTQEQFAAQIRALLARPDYATAHDNMGDAYLQMAADAYQRAATLQPGNRAASCGRRSARQHYGNLY